MPGTDIEASVELTDIEAVEHPAASHEFLMHQEQKEKEELDFHQKMASTISRAALKDSLGDRVRRSYDGDYFDEELECLDNETEMDKVKRMRAQRLAVQKKSDTKNKRVIMERFAAERDDNTERRTYDVKPLPKKTPSSAESKTDDSGSEDTQTAAPDTKLELNEMSDPWDDLGCGVCVRFAVPKFTAWTKRA